LSKSRASGPSRNHYGNNARHVCVAVSQPIKTLLTPETHSNFREENMWKFTKTAIQLLEEVIRENCLK
jgi:hypothetical protein